MYKRQDDTTAGEDQKEKVNIKNASTQSKTTEKKNTVSNNNDPYINFETDEKSKFCTDIESPDDFTTYHRDDYTVAYPTDFFSYGESDDSGAYFDGHPYDLSYSFEENSYSSVSAAYDSLYKDIDNYRSVINVIVDKPKDGRLILSGQCEGYHGCDCSFYYLANITKDHIYIMDITMPLCDDEEEAMHHSYIIDTLYRYCSFNGSDKEEKHTPRSYDALVSSGEYDNSILMSNDADKIEEEEHHEEEKISASDSFSGTDSGLDIDENYVEDYYSIGSPEDFTTTKLDGYTVGYPKEFFFTGYTEGDYIKLHGSDTSELVYEHNLNEYGSVSECYDSLYDVETGLWDSFTPIIEKPEEGRLIISGEKEMDGVQYSVYYLANISDDDYYVMDFFYPTYGDEEGFLRQSYVVDCLYRLCEFNGSDKKEKHSPRSYSDFVDSGEY